MEDAPQPMQQPVSPVPPIELSYDSAAPSPIRLDSRVGEIAGWLDDSGVVNIKIK
jgi:hypothetical protein